MKAAIKIIICLSFISLACTLVPAQVLEGAEKEFESAVNQYTENYQNLQSSRGLPSIPLQKIPEAGQTESQQEAAESFLLRGAAPLSVKYARSSSLSGFTQALRNNFASGTALIFYAYQDGSLQIWLIGQEGLQAYSSRAMTQQKLESVIYDLRNSLGVDSLQANRAPSLRNPNGATADVRLKKSTDSAIADVTDVLLPSPIAERLSSVRHLIVAPILGIGTVPFAILRPFKSDAFLIEKMSVSVVPNLFDIEDNTKAWTPRYRNPLVVGNPYFPPDANWKVPPLPGAEEEALAIAKMINARPLIRRRATKRRVMARAANADFLYFATHGIASSDDPLTGGFLFLTDRSLTKGFWTAKEIQSSRLTAQLAVLSACQTGLGKIHDAGVIGLSRAFQIAGVPRVVMSLWSVNDKATAELMKSFVKYLRSNVPSEALRLAMLEVKRDRPQLSQWASFVLFGTPR
ncbi:MAG TPA: CHAT domain-containing protein [Pyrinomonadaceae bacterium]|jgi:CHAT domain-containing protein